MIDKIPLIKLLFGLCVSIGLTFVCTVGIHNFLNRAFPSNNDSLMGLNNPRFVQIFVRRFFYYCGFPTVLFVFGSTVPLLPSEFFGNKWDQVSQMPKDTLYRDSPFECRSPVCTPDDPATPAPIRNYGLVVVSLCYVFAAVRIISRVLEESIARRLSFIIVPIMGCVPLIFSANPNILRFHSDVILKSYAPGLPGWLVGAGMVCCLMTESVIFILPRILPARNS